MIFEIIKIIIVSIIIIVLCHNLYKYLINELTVKKTNNILYDSSNEYKNIYNIIDSANENKKNEIKQINENNENVENNLEQTQNNKMEESLQEYYNQINNIKD